MSAVIGQSLAILAVSTRPETTAGVIELRRDVVMPQAARWKVGAHAAMRRRLERIIALTAEAELGPLVGMLDEISAPGVNASETPPGGDR